jgi:AraC-like DNA-binding protein
MTPVRSTRDAALATGTPVFEHVVTGEAETFLWRCDDYPWERNVWNVHPEVEIHLVRNASGVALVGDHIGPFEPGHLAMVGGGLPHDWVTPVRPGERIPARDIVVQFHPDRLLQAASVLPEVAEVRSLLDAAERGLAFQGETRRHAAEIMEAMGAVDGLERLALFFRLLRTLASSRDRLTLSSENFVPSTDHRTLGAAAAAFAFVVENFRRDIRLTDLADHLGLSESACSRFFKKNSGNSFTDYVAQLRIGHACKLLSETGLPVTDVCFEVGYGNLSNFNRIFRQQRGLTPSAYRRLARNRRITPNPALTGTDAVMRAASL